MANKVTVKVGSEFDKKGIEQAKSGLGELDGKTKSTGASMVAGFAAVGVAVAVVGKVIQGAIRLVRDLESAYFEQEKAETALRAAIAATGRSAEISAQAIGDYAASLQKVTVFGDEAIISATALLQQLANLDERGLKRVIPSVLDFATALGVSLETAASLVGKTIGSSTNALTRYGVEVDMSLSKSDKLAAVISGLEEKFGGLAEAIGETAYAAKEQLSNAFGDLKEAGGQLASLGLQPVREWLTEVIEGMTEAAKQTLAFKAVVDGTTSGKQQEIGGLQAQKALVEQGRLAEAWGLISHKVGTSEWKERLRIALMDNEEKKEAIRLIDQQINNIEKQLYWEKRLGIQIETNTDLTDAQTQALQDAADMARTLDTYAQTTEGKMAALNEDIKFFMSGDTKNPLVIAILDMLNEKLEALELSMYEATTDQRFVMGLTDAYETAIIDGATAALQSGEAATAAKIFFENSIMGAIVGSLGLVDITPTKYSKGGGEHKEGTPFETTPFEVPEVPEPFVELDTVINTLSSSIGGTAGELAKMAATSGMAGVAMFALGKVMDGVMSVLGPSIDMVLDPLISMLRAVGEVIGALLIPVFQAIQPVIDMLVDKFVWLYNNALVPVGNVLILLMTVINWVSDQMRTAIHNVIEFSLHPFNENKRDNWEYITWKEFKKQADYFGNKLEKIVREDLESGGKFDYDDDSGAGTGGDSVYGGSMTVQRVPDIYVYNTYNGVFIGEGGKADMGQFMVECIQEYVGGGGTVEFAEGAA